MRKKSEEQMRCYSGFSAKLLEAPLTGARKLAHLFPK